jgi:xanthine dehydrogenase accessory factor
MHSLNQQVILKVNEWLLAYDRVWFVTIVSTWGASPRPAGSLFAYNQSKNIQVGSISGGCIESDLVDVFRRSEEKVEPFTLRYGGEYGDGAKYQLPCGGKVDLVIELLDTSVHLAHFSQLEQLLIKRVRVERFLSLDSGLFGCNVAAQINPAGIAGQQDSSVDFTNNELVCFFGPEYRLLIVGVGDVSKCLIPLAQSVDFNVTLCDPRTEYIERYRADQWGIEVCVMLPDDLIRARFNDEYSAVVALAHDPRVDDLALLEALNSPVFYVGAMGSDKTTLNRKARLQQLDLSDSVTSKLHAPIGLSIHSKTPAEIAISIIAHLVKVRHEYTNDS